MARISETELIIPALYIIANTPKTKTSDLIERLTEVFQPTGEDAKILKGRTDTKFSQIVRNLVSHDTLAGKPGYTTYQDKIHKITPEGEEHLSKHIDVIEYLFGDTFVYEDLTDAVSEISKPANQKRRVLTYDENILISEGKSSTRKSKVYDRSKRLRDFAVEKFTENGKQICAVCGFDFEKSYGTLGKGFIEIHHIKPIYQYEDEDYNQFLNEAIENLCPLCSNCHRMIHRAKSNPLSPQELRTLVELMVSTQY